MNKVVASEDRSAKWNRKYDPERIKQINEEGKPTYYQHVQAMNIELEQMELGVKQEVDSQGVPPRDVRDYLNFGRQVWKACRTHTGRTLANKVQIFLDRWTSEGLTQSVLEAIRDNVFHVPAPAGP